MSGTERYQVAFQEGSRVNWMYKTVSQFGSVVDYSRGKGLGGSTAINFCGWVIGPRHDYDEWARLVGDETFAWQNARRVLRRVERLHYDVPEPYQLDIRPRKLGEYL
jgi:choline dehydrogenase-like flavoprotein